MPKATAANVAGKSVAGKRDLSRARPAHDRALFEALIVYMRTIEPEIRAGSIFGSPAAFVGKRMVFCVFGSAIGAKIPESEAKRLIASGAAVAFRPYGKPAMREWIELPAKPADAPKLTSILSLALRHAKDDASNKSK